MVVATRSAMASGESSTRTPWKLALLTAAAAASAAKSRTRTPWAAHTSSAMSSICSALRPLTATV